MQCPQCHEPNPESQKFCGNCGANLDPTLDAVHEYVTANLPSAVEAALDRKIKSQAIVEIETAQAVVSRLLDWAKLFGTLVGIPAAIIIALLGFFGIRTYTDISKAVDTAKTSIEIQMERVAQTADKLQDEVDKLETQRDDLRKRLGEMETDLASLQTNVFKARSEYDSLETRVGRSAEVVAEVRVALSTELLATGLNAIQKNQLAEAEEAFDRAESLIISALAESPDNTQLQNLKGYLYKNYAILYRRLDMKDKALEYLDDAEKAFRITLSIDDQDPGALNGMGSVFILRGDLDTAEAYILKALEINPDYQAAKQDLALIERLRESRPPE